MDEYLAYVAEVKKYTDLTVDEIIKKWKAGEMTIDENQAKLIDDLVENQSKF
jgi:hypothetical protein